jgi:hypothetical protein
VEGSEHSSTHWALKVHPRFLPESFDGSQISGTAATSKFLSNEPSCANTVTSATPSIQSPVYSTDSRASISSVLMQTSAFLSLYCTANQLNSPFFTVCVTLNVMELPSLFTISKLGLVFALASLDPLKISSSTQSNMEGVDEGSCDTSEGALGAGVPSEGVVGAGVPPEGMVGLGVSAERDVGTGSPPPKPQ